MDINTLRGIATVLALLAFLAICAWAYSGRRKQRFKEASMAPFADEPNPPGSTEKQPESTVKKAQS